MRLISLLAACLFALPASAGWVRIAWAPTAGVTALRSGCVAAGQYERPSVAIAGSSSGTVTLAGLPDSGRCYFALNAGPQDEWTYDFTALAGGRAVPGAVRNLEFAWTPTPAAPTLTSVDIGPVGAVGSTTLANGVYTVRGSGADVWGTADEFRFAYRQLDGDGSITARISSLTNTHAWAKAGVMIRDSLAPSSQNVFLRLTPSNGVDVNHRPTAGAATIGAAPQPSVSTPYWLRLTRTGNTFAAFVSPDGVAWTARGSVVVVMGQSPHVGLAATSHVRAALGTAVFDNVSVIE